MEKKEIGNWGEKIARDYLISKQCKIMETQWTFGHLEIDIIAENEEFIIFCEVKTRSSTLMMSPQDAVNTQKQRNMIRAANHYIVKHKISKEVRFDIISIVKKGETHTLEHIPAAFMPKWG